MATKRQQTMAKITRERAVKEKRERKLEKKRAAAAERRAKADGTWVPPDETPAVDASQPAT
jgi:cell division protein FtsB